MFDEFRNEKKVVRAVVQLVHEATTTCFQANIDPINCTNLAPDVI